MKRLINLNKPNVIILALVVLFFSISCEDDFTTVGGDFINTLDLPPPYAVQNLSTYSDDILSVQSNTLNTYLLGEYKDPIFGNNSSSILSQLQIPVTNPDFGTAPEIDSVVLTLPFLSNQIIETDVETGIDTYRVDSIFGEGTFRLGVYESKQFLRTINPGQNGDFEESQLYYSNQFSEIESNILFSNPLTVEENDNGEFVPVDLSQDITPSQMNKTEILVDRTDTIERVGEDGDTIVEFEKLRFTPRIRVKLDPMFFKEKIIDQQNTINLVSQNSFNDFFRGIYLRAVQQDPDGEKSMININLRDINTNQDQQANITIYYRAQRPVPSSGTDSDSEDEQEFENTFNEFVLNFGGNIINFYENTSEPAVDFSAQDTVNGEENMFIKGGQGVVGIIDPFNGPDGEEEIDSLRTLGWLVNEANIILYVNEDLTQDLYQPFRIFAYDLDRERVLIDYNLDQTNSANLFTSRSSHLGVLEEENGNKFYKIRVTSHINNIINNDSTNTRIAVVITQNVNQSRILEVKDSELNQVESFIESSMSSPRGTVFHGNLSDNEEKKLKLQIYYTDPNN